MPNPLARGTDPDTSHEAASSVNLSRGRAQVLDLLRLGPATDDQLNTRAMVRRVRISPSGLRTRRAELVSAGLVEPTGSVARTSSGRHSIVWRVAGDA